MKLTLFRKLLFLYLAILLAAFILVSTVGAYLVDQTLIHTSALQLYREAGTIAEQQASDTSASVDPATEEALQALAVYQGAEIWIMDTDGNILMTTSDTGTASPRQITDFDPAKLGSSYYMTGDFFGYFEEETVSVLAPISGSYAVNGYLAIHIPVSAVVEQRETILKVVHEILTFILLLTLLIPFFVYFQIHRPMQKVIRAAQEYGSGNLQYELKLNSNDELGELAEALNFMSAELNQSSENQKKFIANVSHDFRSPLTSIKGYAEAFLDGTIPPEMQERYLKIIVNETERLNKLTRSMLTLNNLNKKNFYLEQKEFDINETIRNTAASFEGICTSRRISIELVFEDEIQMVYADRDRIQQVLYNLIDNALKFSKSHSSIRIETVETHNRIEVSVADHGTGIPAAYLPRIWNRFYKVDSSRGKDRKGTGLGLSIVKEIIQAHGQKITVVSTEGVGTTFTFTLAREKQDLPAEIS